MEKSGWSELELIKLFADCGRGDDSSGLIKGIGDDCAVFENLSGSDWVTTTDILVERVHFDRSWHPPRLLGRKSVAVNLSDVAAMGGVPRYALVSIALPPTIEHQWISEWHRGVMEMLGAHKCVLIGGDTATSEVLTINVVVIGSVTTAHALMRSSAQVGENIYVSGTLGSAGAGLEICRNEDLFSSIDETCLAPLRRQHLDPEPEVALGKLLGRSSMVGAMQDLSDGLATDIAHIAEQSGVGAEIDAAALPAADGLEPVCRILGTPVASMQVSGGEDYKLVFTVKKQKDAELISVIRECGMEPVHRIGRIVADPGVRLKVGSKWQDISFQGYEHRG